VYKIPEGTNYILATYPYNAQVFCKVAITTRDNLFIENDLVIRYDKVFDDKVEEHLKHFTKGFWIGFRKGNYIIIVQDYLVEGLNSYLSYKEVELV